ncbi:MAG: ABC transporter permease subunit [Oscillospiraceae bacterium]|nr:ABC transporter permease subunit [Oscillospiraceae bacterium]
MKNIMKAQLFQLQKERLCFIVLAVMLIFVMYTAWFADYATSGDVSGGEFFVENISMILQLIQLPILMLVGQMCVGDFTDKTANFELMGGHKRCEVYLGRAIPAILVNMLLSLISIIIPLVFMTCLAGWGIEVIFSHFILRLSMILLVQFRLICMFVFFSFLVKNQFVVMGIAYLYFALNLSGIFSETASPMLTITNFNLLYGMGGWYTYGIEDSVNLTYDLTMTAPEIAWTVIASLGVSAVALALGYVFFKNDDMN